MKIANYGAAGLYRTGTPLAEDGDGVAWRCDLCPNGEPGSPDYPCKHLRYLFDTSSAGKLGRRLRLTDAGREAWASCPCNPNPGAPAPSPVTPPPAAGTTTTPSRSMPCPCGSGEKYKRCHGAPGALPLPPPPKRRHPRGDVVPPVLPREPPRTPTEKRRRTRAEKLDQVEAWKARVAPILDAIRAKDEAKAAKRAAYDRARRAKR